MSMKRNAERRMEPFRRKRVLLGMCLALACAACSSVPKAPTVSDSHRRPVNSSEAIELQSCRGQLKNTELLLQETAKLATSASSALANTAARCATSPGSPSETHPETQPGPATSSAAPAAAEANKVYVLLFRYGSTQIDLLERDTMELAAAASRAELVEIRGRTDGSVDEAGNQRVARRRAEAVRDYLVALGVEPARIRVTYQAVGDHIANNDQEEGRALNRRAEVEIYPTVPAREVLTTRAEIEHADGGSYVSR